MTWEELETVLSKVESAVNKRPISFIYEGSSSDIPLALTPEMFLHGASVRASAESPSTFTDLLCGKFEWGKKMEVLWRNEYLMGVLGESKKIWKRVRPLKKGEVVLVEDDFKRRQTWPLAVVDEVFAGVDGKVRAARVRTASGVLTRPIRKLYPLEIPCEDGQDSSVLENVDGVTPDRVEVIPAEPEPHQTTRSGRVVRKPTRYVL